MSKSNDSIDYAIGQKFGEYRLQRKLGGGGCGDVYLGEHVHDQTSAAVKLLRARLTSSEELKAFINEARAIRLKHPNIVSLLDFGIGADDIPFLVMQYAPHGTLRTHHPKGAKLPVSTIMAYVNPIASALQYAHDLHLVHRDVKPENMLVGADGEILLSDFGIATVAYSSHPDNEQESPGGTIVYMAPEQFSGKPCAASDQYALAVVVYEWLCGGLPFKGMASEVALQHSFATPPSLCAQVPDLSREVERVVLTALAKEPQQRFASVLEFAAALEEASQIEQTSNHASAHIALHVYEADEIPANSMFADGIAEPLAEPLADDVAVAASPEQSDPATLIAATRILPPTLSAALTVFNKRITVIGFVLALLIVTSTLVYALANRPVTNYPSAAMQNSPAGSDGTKVGAAVPAGITATFTTVSATATTRTNPSPIATKPTSVRKTVTAAPMPTTASRVVIAAPTPTPTRRPVIVAPTPTPIPTRKPVIATTKPTPTRKPVVATTKPTPTSKPVTISATPEPLPTPTPVAQNPTAVDGQNPNTYEVNGRTCMDTLSNSQSQRVDFEGITGTLYFRFSVTCHAAWALIIFDRPVLQGHGNARVVRSNDGRFFTCDMGGSLTVSPGQTFCYTGMVYDGPIPTATVYATFTFADGHTDTSAGIGPY